MCEEEAADEVGTTVLAGAAEGPDAFGTATSVGTGTLVPLPAGSTSLLRVMRLRPGGCVAYVRGMATAGECIGLCVLCVRACVRVCVCVGVCVCALACVCHRAEPEGGIN